MSSLFRAAGGPAAFRAVRQQEMRMATGVPEHCQQDRGLPVSGRGPSDRRIPRGPLSSRRRTGRDRYRAARPSTQGTRRLAAASAHRLLLVHLASPEASAAGLTTSRPKAPPGASFKVFSRTPAGVRPYKEKSHGSRDVPSLHRGVQRMRRRMRPLRQRMLVGAGRDDDGPLHSPRCGAVLLATGIARAESMQPGMPMPMKPAAPAASAPANNALVAGEVRKVDLEKGLVSLRHGDIPNLAMPPMTMGFDVLDKKMLTGFGSTQRFHSRAHGCDAR